eukprot:356139-Chlamydomonas_euryale.AAC.6
MKTLEEEHSLLAGFDDARPHLQLVANFERPGLQLSCSRCLLLTLVAISGRPGLQPSCCRRLHLLLLATCGRPGLWASSKQKMLAWAAALLVPQSTPASAGLKVFSNHSRDAIVQDNEWRLAVSAYNQHLHGCTVRPYRQASRPRQLPMFK